MEIYIGVRNFFSSILFRAQSCWCSKPVKQKSKGSNKFVQASNIVNLHLCNLFPSFTAFFTKAPY